MKFKKPKSAQLSHVDFNRQLLEDQKSKFREEQRHPKHSWYIFFLLLLHFYNLVYKTNLDLFFFFYASCYFNCQNAFFEKVIKSNIYFSL